MMGPVRSCPTCGNELSPRDPAGLCPVCLLRAGRGEDRSVEDPDSGAVNPSLPAASSGVFATLAEAIGGPPRILLSDTDPGEEPSLVVKPDSPEMPAAGDRGGRYQLLGEIAHGGMGAVLRGRDAELGRDIAVKVLLEAHKDNPELVRRFIEEAQIGGQLQHPGVVPIYDVGSFADRRPFFAMKLVKGRTMAALLHARKDPDDDGPRLVGIFATVCQTMAYAHTRGVIHRDLKPSNVIVGSFGEVQVMDWGLAKVLLRGGLADDATAGVVDDGEAGVATPRSGSASELSQAGSVMGTPAYMAPEQARGEVDRIDERADVFAMGSILCEVLTGEPAFTGRNSAEIQRKAARGDLIGAMSRLEACGADPELIGLAKDCLAAERDARPRSAREMAGAMTTYLAGVQDRLRQTELARARADARAAEERKRRRLTLALAASVIGMILAGAGGWSWTERQRRDRDRERSERAARVDRALDDARLLLGRAERSDDDPSLWSMARDAARAVERMQPDARDDPTRRSIGDVVRAVDEGATSAERDRTLLDELIGLRLAESDDPGASSGDAPYRSAFRQARLDVDALGAEAAAARIKARPPGVRPALAAALDDWAARRRRARPRQDESWMRLIAAARLADPDPLRDRLRRIALEPDRVAGREPLLRLAGEADPREWPAASLILLAGALADANEHAAAADLLGRTQAEHPGDVWVNYNLARALERLRPPRTEEAIRYYTAARALRRDTAHDLAHALAARGRGDQARAVFEDLTRRRGSNGRDWMCLGLLLRGDGDRAGSQAALGKAVAAFREAIRLRPDVGYIHSNLGDSLAGQGKPAEAIDEYRAAIRLEPDRAMPHYNLANVLAEQGRPDEAIDEYRAAIRLEPEFSAYRSNLGLALLAHGRPAEAVAQFREAIRLTPENPRMHNNLGMGLQAVGDFKSAASALRRARELAGPDAERRLPDIGRRVAEAERQAALADRLPAVLRGEVRPTDPHDLLAFAYLCAGGRRVVPAARLFGEAFRADRKLADDMIAQNRYNAACVAALASSGEGDERPPLDAPARARWRLQALEWLRADLAYWAGQVRTRPVQARAPVARTLRHWRSDPDLAGIRDAGMVKALAEEERGACRDLWNEIDTLLKACGAAAP